MKESRLRLFLAGICYVGTFAGAIIGCIAGFMLTGWYVINYGISGIEEAFNQKSFFDILRYALPLLFVKFIAFFAGFIGLCIGWIPGYAGIVWLEKDDEDYWLQYGIKTK